MARPRSWTDTDLRNAIAVATSWRDTALALGLAPTSTKSLRAIRRRAQALGLDHAHFRKPDGRPRAPVPVLVTGTPAQRRERARGSYRTWTDAELRDAVAVSRSWAGVHRALGLRVGGSTYRRLQDQAAELGLDSSHFLGRGWAKGSPNPGGRPARRLDEILIRGSDYDRTHMLRLRLVHAGLKEARCEGCDLDEWRGAAIPLQLDHVNGERSDNRLENLRILCPNCHAQTSTWCGKNMKRQQLP